MLKTLKRDDTTLTPYIATKDWNLSNVANTDLVLAENGNPVAVENVNYEFLFATPNYNCNVAKEDQSNDLATVRDGLKVTGLFYPELDPQNIDGTYKRMVYTQVRTMFYNHYRDPTQMWGLEKIDFDTSETKKFLSDLIKVFYIPTNIMGHKIVEGSVQVIDNTLDNNYTITDDGHNNLFAGDNLFSKQQIVGNFLNVFVSGSDSTCNAYFNFNPPAAPGLTGSLFNVISGFGSGSLSWSYNDLQSTPLSGFGLEKSTDGINYSLLSFFSASVFSTYDYPLSSSQEYFYRLYAFNVWGSSSYSNVVSLIISQSIFNFTNYDLLSSSFKLTTKTLPATRGFLNPYVVSGSVYLIGGFNGSTWMNTIWSSSATEPFVINDTGKTFPMNAFGSGRLQPILIVGNKIFSFGGSNTVFNTSSIYSASINSPAVWGFAGNMPQKMNGHSVIQIGNKLWSFFGQDASGNFISASYTASTSDPLTWGYTGMTSSADLVNYLGSIFGIDNKIYIYGGSTTGSSGGAGFNNYTQYITSASTSNPGVWGIGNINVQTWVSEDGLFNVGSKHYTVGGVEGASDTARINIYSGSSPQTQIIGLATLPQINDAGTVIVTPYSGSYTVIIYGGFDGITYHNRIYSGSISSSISASAVPPDYSMNPAWRILPNVQL